MKTINVNDKVTITNIDKVYTTYDVMFKNLGFEYRSTHC